jgi:ferric-dicitrate binding protein FerR (iron transport regulator)
MDLLEQYTELIYKYLNGTASKNELNSLLAWLKSKKESIIIFNEIVAIWEQSNKTVNDHIDTELALSRLNKKINHFKEAKNHSDRRLITRLVNVAAAFVILIAMSFFVKYILLKPSSKPLNINYITVYTPPSQKSQLTLSDGTMIWLNSGTKIKYSSQYGLQTRDIYLEGEAFFQVAKNPGKPFFVHASSITVRAVGTSFNIKCYASDKTIETTLVEGQVQISGEKKSGLETKPFFLSPNEKAVFSKQNQKIQIARFEEAKPIAKPLKEEIIPFYYEQKTILSEISWKDQQLVFENETFGDLAKRLERWYNMNIRINDDRLLGNRYTGKFVNNESIEQVLLVIGRTTPIIYTIDKDNVIIDSKK